MPARGPTTPSTSPTSCDRKFAALKSHVTQVSHHEDLEGFVTAWMRQTAERFGLPDGRLAEAFHVVHTA